MSGAMMLFNMLLINLLVWTPVLCIDDVTKDLLTPMAEFGEACGYQSCPEIRPNYLNVHIVPATHAELGGTRTFHEHYVGVQAMFEESDINMKDILDSVLTSLWHTRTRTFSLSDIPYFFHWWKNRDATVKRMVYELLRQGRLFLVGGGWGMSDESAAHYHAIIDHYTYALRKINATFLECGRPLVTWQADTFGHSREFASLMAQMGFDGHFISPISYDDELSRMRSKSLEFVWRGSDDLGAETDIFTHKLFDGYWSPPGFCFGQHCSDPLIVTSSTQFSNVVERIQAFGKLMQVRQGPYYTTNNVMVVMGQRMGYYDSRTWYANIDKLINYVNEAKAKAGLRLRMFYSTPACYLREVQRAQPMLKTKQDDFFPMAYDKDTYFTGMYYSRASIKYLARELHLLVFIAKQLQLSARLDNNDKLFEDMQWMTGAILDHTILTGAMSSYVTQYYLVKIHKAKQLSMRVIKPGLNKLRRAAARTTYHLCPFNASSCWTTSDSRSYIVIYNPLAWPVTLPVRIPVPKVQYNIYDPKGDKVLHSMITIPDLVKYLPERSQPTHQPAFEDELVFIAENVPPMGYRSYYLEKHNKAEKINSSPRTKREILKKLKNNKKRKYITLQTQNAKPDGNLVDEYDQEDYLEGLTDRPTIIEFANVSKGNEDPMEDYDYVLTPRSRPLATSAATESSAFRDGFDLPPFNNTSPYLLPSRRIYPSRTTTEPPPPSRTNYYMNSDDIETWNSTSTPETTTPTSTTTSNPTTNGSTTTSESSPIANDVETVLTTSATYTETSTPVYYDEEPSHNVTDDEDNEERITWEEELELRRLENVGYLSVETTDDFIRNEYIKINLDRKLHKVTSIILSNGVLMNLDISMWYYVSDDPRRMGTNKKSPGAHIFRPMDPAPELISKNPSSKVLKSELVQEVQLQFSTYAAASLSLYKDLPYVELDWLVGPIPVHDQLGKEVFIRYSTDLANNGVFYTDSNGRQTIKRIKNTRPTYTPQTSDEVSSNFYPVISKVYMEDMEKNIRFSVFPDRGEGCTSLNQGVLDIMLHRRILTDDTGIHGVINETEFDKGLVVRGKHRLYLSKADYKPNKFFEKKFAKELELQPKVFTSPHPFYDPSISYTNWSTCRNEYTALKSKVPIGIHILSFEKWNHQLMIRLENYLEKKDVVKNGIKTVNILGLFKTYVITDCKETMLATNIWKSNYFKMQWQKDKFVKNFNDVYGNSSNLEFADEEVSSAYEKPDFIKGIQLVPQEIRTFICSYEISRRMH